MPSPPATTTPLAGPLDDLLPAIPRTAGVGQILGPAGQPLVTGRAANLRRWAASHLGRAPARRTGRPPTDLSPIASALRHAVTGSAFEQRLVFERWMAAHVPAKDRRDLKPPAYLRLDPAERFPRVTVVGSGPGLEHLFGPFRGPRAAEAAVKALHRAFPLRPCDFVFEPDPALSLGLACLFAQVRSCSAPCLSRIGEEAYRALAREAAAFLAEPSGRSGEAAASIPPFAGGLARSRGLVAARVASGIALYPVLEGMVLEEEAAIAEPHGLEAAVRVLRWEAPRTRRDDLPWLSQWLHGPRRRDAFLRISETVEADLAGRILAALDPG